MLSGIYESPSAQVQDPVSCARSHARMQDRAKGETEAALRQHDAGLPRKLLQLLAGHQLPAAAALAAAMGDVRLASIIPQVCLARGLAVPHGPLQRS